MPEYDKFALEKHLLRDPYQIPRGVRLCVEKMQVGPEGVYRGSIGGPEGVYGVFRDPYQIPRRVRLCVEKMQVGPEGV
jgi:hypothetical protein